MPLVVIGIVGDLIFMDILALAPHSSQLDELAGVDLVGSTSAILEFSRNPSAVDNNRCTVNSNRVLFSESSAERETTALIAVERIDHIIPLQLVAGLIYVGCGDQHFLGGVELRTLYVTSTRAPLRRWFVSAFSGGCRPPDPPQPFSPTQELF